MENRIDVNPIHQIGHSCKITAIATIEKHFANQLGFKPIPLHKHKTALISIRQLSKEHGSRQGELLEVRQFPEIFADLGYETEIIDVQANLDSFQKHVTTHIQQGNLVIACFAVDRNTGNPSIRYEQDNEHAAILHGCDATGALEMAHWGQRITTTMRQFYDSSMVLPTQRNPEYYVNIKHRDKTKKYDLHSDQTGESLPKDYKKSITPAPNSGFRGKLIVIKQPTLEKILQAREKLLHKKMTQLLTQLKRKTTQLIARGEYDSQYNEVSQQAKTLNTQLDNAHEQLLINKNFDQFKNTCNTAIQAAAPEFKKHRGWHQVHFMLRGILGVLAGLTIIPGIVISAGVKQGYIGTFFETPKTDSEEKLEFFKKNLNDSKNFFH